MLRSETRTAWGVLSCAFLLGACTGSIGGGSAYKDDGGGSGGEDGNGGEGGSRNGGSGAPGACRVAVPLRRLTEVQYRNAIRDVFKGQATLPSDFAIPTLGSPTSGFTNDPGYNAVDLGVARRLNDTAITVPLSIVDKLPTLLPCAATPNDACAQTFIDTFGRRAYRRPLEASEKATLMKAFKLGTGADAFKDGIAAVVATMLESPQFLYQTEAGTSRNGAAGVTQLSGYELASRLSLMLWDSVPDDALLDAAGGGKLDTAAGIRAQVDRILDDAKARPVVSRFVREWVHLPSVEGGQRQDKMYTDALAAAMQSEFDQFVGDSFLGQGKSVSAFFTSSAPYKNATLDGFIKANGGYAERAGILTQPALLTGIANPSDTSPIRRSVFVRSKLTCESFPAPPNDAQSVESALTLPTNATQRQRSDARSKNSRCVGCHNLIDPLGFGFERFDELGRFRTTNKDGSSLNASGEFVSPVSPELEGRFATLPELGERLAKSDAVTECMARQLFRFNYGRMEEDADTCSVMGIADKFRGSGLGLRDLIVSVVTADEFRFRKVQ